VLSFHNHIDLTLLTQTNAGPAKARNSGALQAKGEFLAFTDDDCIPASDWLKNLAARCTSGSSNHAIGGSTLNALKENPYSSASQIIIDAVYSYYNADPTQARFAATNNLTVPKDQFLRLGGFNTIFRTSEDREFCNRWLSHGNSIIYAQEVVVYHAHDLSLRSFLRQHFNYGCGSFHFHQLLPGLNGKLKRLAPKLYYLLAYPLLKKRHFQTITQQTLVVISQMASAMGYAWEVSNSKQRRSSYRKTNCLLRGKILPVDSELTKEKKRRDL